MLDVAYGYLGAFITDCAKFGYDAAALLASGEYVQCNDGWIVAREFVA